MDNIMLDAVDVGEPDAIMHSIARRHQAGEPPEHIMVVFNTGEIRDSAYKLLQTAIPDYTEYRSVTSRMHPVALKREGGSDDDYALMKQCITDAVLSFGDERMPQKQLMERAWALYDKRCANQ